MIDVVTTPSLTLKSAQDIAERAISKAQEMELKIHVHVTDATGFPLVYMRLPGAPLQAREMSEKKAATAANFKAPTHEWATKVFKKPNVAAGLAHHPKIALIGGGMPILLNKIVVGAIGIAGALEEQDVEIASYVLSTLENQ